MDAETDVEVLYLAATITTGVGLFYCCSSVEADATTDVAAKSDINV